MSAPLVAFEIDLLARLGQGKGERTRLSPLKEKDRAPRMKGHWEFGQRSHSALRD
jgi:hypothetical protein